MRILLEEHAAKFHPDQIWNDGASSFFEERRPIKNNTKNKMSSDMGIQKNS